MQTELNTTGVKSAGQSLDNPGFDQMAQTLSAAIADFSKDSPAILASIVSALRPIGDYSLKAWSFATGYVRRHPVQTAIGVVALGFIAAQLMKKNEMMSSPKSSDGRQY